jgi:hypothetical protein
MPIHEQMLEMKSKQVGRDIHFTGEAATWVGCFLLKQ